MWFAEQLAEPQLVGDPGRAQFITAFNAGLNWRKVDKNLHHRIGQLLAKVFGSGPAAPSDPPRLTPPVQRPVVIRSHQLEGVLFGQPDVLVIAQLGEVVGQHDELDLLGLCQS